MSRPVTFYYGMSGTFKRTTIQSIVDNFGPSQYYPLWSMIKPWKYFDRILFPSRRGSDLDYALLHLVRLRAEVSENETTAVSEILSERGVSDMLFYYNQAEGSIAMTDEEIRQIVREEELLTEQNSYLIPKKILMVQLDIRFIENTILTQPDRKACFKDVRDYLEKQDKYIEFTKKYNDITETIEIKDAAKYIEDLGLEFRP